MVVGFGPRRVCFNFVCFTYFHLIGLAFSHGYFFTTWDVVSETVNMLNCQANPVMIKISWWFSWLIMMLSCILSKFGSLLITTSFNSQISWKNFLNCVFSSYFTIISSTSCCGLIPSKLKTKKLFILENGYNVQWASVNFLRRKWTWIQIK